MITRHYTKTTSELVIWAVAKSRRNLAINWRITRVRQTVKEMVEERPRPNKLTRCRRWKTFRHHIRRKWWTRTICLHSRLYNRRASVCELTNSNYCCSVTRKQAESLALVEARRSNLLTNRNDWRRNLTTNTAWNWPKRTRIWKRKMRRSGQDTASSRSRHSTTAIKTKCSSTKV